MILANKNGWLIVVDILKETDRYFHVQERDGTVLGTKWKLSKIDASRKLFDNVYDAEKWIRE